jgi:hypothetical protein
MDWLKFILSVIEAIAWPVAFVAAVVFLRQEWADIIGRFQGIKRKETKIKFGNHLPQASKTAKSFLRDSVDLASKELAQRLKLAGSSPRGAILESWIEVEAALGALKLGNETALGESASGLLQSLREMRNDAFYVTDKAIDVGAAKEYVSLANRLAVFLKETQ